MKNRFFVALLIPITVLMLSTLFQAEALAKGSSYLPSVDINDKFIVVDDLGAEFHGASNTVTVTAKIKNVSRSVLKGYATIYLLSPSGQELYTYQEEVNNGEGFRHGATVNFKATTHVPDLHRVGTISVDFTRK